MLSPDRILHEQAQSEKEIRTRFQHFAFSVADALANWDLPGSHAFDGASANFRRRYSQTSVLPSPLLCDYLSFLSQPTENPASCRDVLLLLLTLCAIPFADAARRGRLPSLFLRWKCNLTADSLAPTSSTSVKVHIGYALPSIVLFVIPPSPLRHLLHLTFRSALVSAHHAQRDVSRTYGCKLFTITSGSSRACSAHSFLMSRPSLGLRSISEQAPLYDPSSAPHSGSRLRGSQATSGAHTSTGSQLPYSPLLPLPPASMSKLAPRLPDVLDVEQIENQEPISKLTQHDRLAVPGALAARRLTRRGVSDGFGIPTHDVQRSRSSAMMTSFPSSLGPKAALRLDIPAASERSAQQPASKSAGMIRSYSLPVATQEEHDEQQRIMALGLSPIGRYGGNTSWWQYGWPSPGGLNYRHVHRSPAVPEFPGQRRRSSQSKLSTVMTPIHAESAGAAASPQATPSASSPAVSRPSSRSSKTHSSCSPKMKAKHLPGIHQHAFQTSATRSASSSPKMGRSPLSTMSINLPAADQQQEYVDPQEDDSDDVYDDDEADVAATPPEAAFDIEMDALNQRFAEWSRSQAMATPSASAPRPVDQDDYFNLVHDDQPGNASLGVGGGSDTSDEARTPRASSPRPLSKGALYCHDQSRALQHRVDDDDSQSLARTDRWSGSFDFIHPDHLA
ncbi:hypothetical protein PHSY_006478 [Pseudozyma hubeiensis SY62]|uniref:Uncharacterized protein n=1 Tax=Pseudozyma hubeiensis (strain SY62) TaxID=1305764 RepID=R9PBV5_PSEHS|nr:hypothetical protein PHSY_006478 [Pseudozyma hubeiensis SY62]GAC98883.1 hypothetical protein PHSY_006478 [Pseudozyma hubeiensis SY62]